MTKPIDTATGEDLFMIGDILGYGEQAYRNKLMVLSQGSRATVEALTQTIESELPFGTRLQILGISNKPPRRWLVRFGVWLLKLAGLEVTINEPE